MFGCYVDVGTVQSYLMIWELIFCYVLQNSGVWDIDFVGTGWQYGLWESLLLGCDHLTLVMAKLFTVLKRQVIWDTFIGGNDVLFEWSLVLLTKVGIADSRLFWS